MRSIGRRIPVRVAYVGVVVSVYVFAVAMQAQCGVESTSLAEVVIGAIGVAIAGDSWRPSGMVATVATKSAGGVGAGGGGARGAVGGTGEGSSGTSESGDASGEGA